MYRYPKSLFRVGILILLLVSTLPGCGVESSEENPVVVAETAEMPATGGIRGQVLPPKIKASVLVVEGYEVLANVPAEENGTFVVPQLSPGRYDLEIIAPNYFTDISLRAVEVVEGEWTDTPVVTLRPWDEAAIVSGHVFDAESRQPIAQVSILIECTTSVCSPLSAQTDAAGAFSIQIWPDLNSNILIRKVGYRSSFLRVDALGPSGQADFEVLLEREP